MEKTCWNNTLKKRLSRCFRIAVPKLLFRVFGGHSENKRELMTIKDKYKGRRCFIVCNGPSLRAEDLDKIASHDDLSIGINLIGKIYSSTNWRADFLVAYDGICFLPNNKEIVETTECAYKVHAEEQWFKTKRSKGRKLYLNMIGDRSLLDEPKFSFDLTDKIYSIGTSAYQAAQVARWLGATEIYIIGCDMSYAINVHKDGSVSKSAKSHFYESGDTVNKQAVQIWEMETAFDALDKISKENGFRVYNATRGGYCESFERVEFDSLF